MPAYVWKGKNRLGEVQEGIIVSDTKDQASATLKRNGIQVLFVKPQTTVTKSFGKVKSRDLAIFTRQFSVMIDAGLPLVQCLEILGGPAAGQGLPEDHRGRARRRRAGRHPPGRHGQASQGLQ